MSANVVALELRLLQHRMKLDVLLFSSISFLFKYN